MITDLIPARSRVLAIGLLVVALALCYLVLVHPIVAAYRETARTIAELEANLVRYQQIGRQLSLHEADLARFQRAQPSGGYFLRSGTDALAAAELQDRVKRLVDSSGGELVSTRDLPVSQHGRFSSVGIQVQMSGSVGTVLLVLYALESGRPLVIVDNVNLRAIAESRFRRTEPEVNRLSASFDVSGFIQAEAL
jgi:general secretion pathway protein M